MKDFVNIPEMTMSQKTVLFFLLHDSNYRNFHLLLFVINFICLKLQLTLRSKNRKKYQCQTAELFHSYYRVAVAEQLSNLSKVWPHLSYPDIPRQPKMQLRPVEM